MPTSRSRHLVDCNNSSKFSERHTHTCVSESSILRSIRQEALVNFNTSSWPRYQCCVRMLRTHAAYKLCSIENFGSTVLYACGLRTGLKVTVHEAGGVQRVQLAQHALEHRGDIEEAALLTPPLRQRNAALQNKVRGKDIEAAAAHHARVCVVARAEQLR